MVGSSDAWFWLTRFGEAQLVLPAAVLAMAALLRRPATRPVAAWWMLLLGTATLMTTASKIAFIGWGLGWATIDFTGISGHAMFAAAVYPLLLATVLAPYVPVSWRFVPPVAGGVLALLIGLSRVVIPVHSLSEVAAGLLVGGLVSAVALARLGRERPFLGPAVPVVVASLLVLMPLHAPASNTHTLVTRFALALSGNTAPYTRERGLRPWGRPVPAIGPSADAALRL